MCVCGSDLSVRVRCTARPQLTPAQYVRIIANAALFRDQGVGAGGGGRVEGGGWTARERRWMREELGEDPAGILQHPASISSHSHAHRIIIPTNYSPALSSYTSLLSVSSLFSLPSPPLLCFCLFSHRLHPPLPQPRTTTREEKYD